MDLMSFPLWLLWLLAVLADAVFIGVVIYIMPSPLRRGGEGRTVIGAGLLFVVWSAITRNDRGVLWLGFLGFLAAAAPLVWLGKLPEDMPSARDPRIYQYPGYLEIKRRGRRAGVGILSGFVLAIVGSMLLVHGLY